MNKLIAVVLSISLIFGSVTPSLAQSPIKKGGQALKAVQATGKELVAGSGSALSNTVKQAAGASVAQGFRYKPGLAVPQTSYVRRVNVSDVSGLAATGVQSSSELSVNIDRALTSQIPATASKSPKEINALLAKPDFAEKDAKEVYDQIFNVTSRHASVKEFLFFDAFPSVTVQHGFAVGADRVTQALEFYRRTLFSNLQAAPVLPASASLDEIVSLSNNSAEFADVDRWAKSMAAVTNLGFYGAAKDASLLIDVYAKTPAALKPVTEVVVGRALLNLQAYEALEQLARLSAVNGELVTPFWSGVKTYAQEQGLNITLPQLSATAAAVKPSKELERLLGSWNRLNVRHVDASAKATADWAALNGAKGKVITRPTEQAPVRETPVPEAPVTPNVEVNLADLHLADNLAVGAAPVPASGTEVSAETAAAETASAPAASQTWLSKGFNRIKSAFSSSPVPAANPISIPVRAGGTISDAALTRAMGLSNGGTLSMGGLGDLTQRINNGKIIKRVHKTLESARNKADTEFIALAQKAQKEGRNLTSEDYNTLLSEKFSAAIAADPTLAPYAQDIARTVADPAAMAPAPAKRELSYSLKIHDAEGKVLPVTFEINMRLLDNTAVKQFEQLGVSNSEVFTLMRATKDGKPTGPFELMLTTPGGSKRPIYEPFIEGGKAGVEALYYRLLGDYQAGKLASNKVDLNLYSDVFAERATMFAGLTEGLGGLPQATVAPQATALGITDPKALQAGVSHSQLGNVASVVFSGLQKEFGIKNTLALGLGIASLGLGICGFGLSLPSLAAKISMLGIGSFVLGVGANGGVKSTNSIFAKEMSNDNISGTARMGFVNARASVGTMTGYLFFPVSVLFALSGVEAFQWLYYGATAVPAYALFNLALSKVRNVGAEHGVAKTWLEKAKVVAKSGLGIFKNIANNVKFALTGGYQERLSAIREKRIVKERTKEFERMMNGQEVVAPSAASSNSLWAKAKDFMTVKVPAATSQYMLRMMALVGLYHFAGMMYNSGPGAIIGNFIKSPEGASIVNWAQNMPLPMTALLAGGAGYALTKLGQKAFNMLSKKFTRGPVDGLAVEQPTTLLEKTGAFTKKHLPWLVGGATGVATAAVPQVYEVAHSIFSRFDPTSVAQIATFFTAYVGVWAGRQYLSGFVKSGKLTPQGIIGASGVLSTVAVSLAFLPFLPLGVKAALWGVAGLGFANLAGFENSLAMEKYPNQKPAVNMAYTLARLSGALTVLYGSLANTFKAAGVADPDINALVLPAGALALATLINGKYFTRNFFQDVRRWRGLPPTLNYKLLRTAADDFYKKYLESGHSVENMPQDAQRIAAKLFEETRHELTTVERLMTPLNEKLRINELRLKVIGELKRLLNGAEQNTVPLGMEELTYKALKTREIQPLLTNLTARKLSAAEEAKVIRSVASVIYNRYFIKAADLQAMERGVMDRNEGLDMFRLEVLRNMYKMELTKIATDRVARYKGNRPSYDRSMDELRGMADKVLGPNHGWKAPRFNP